MATNREVVDAWREGRDLKSSNGNMTSLGGSLFSYNLIIGETREDGSKVVYNYTGGAVPSAFVSLTTSQHVALARYSHKHGSVACEPAPKKPPVVNGSRRGGW